MVKITEVFPKSRAAKAGILADDILVSINQKEINDVLDYRFYLANTDICLEILRGEYTLSFNIHKKEYDDIGLDFETPLMDKKHSCENKCVFCFIDQLPRGMRKTLYFKDDDSRLSFLHGNYVTLTNMSDRDIQRIIDMRISPVNISVHTTNPELRVKMMHNKRAGEVLGYMKKLADAGISLCCQIVLCRGLNDGEELDRSLHDLMELCPALQSVAIVPAGLTDFRDKLYLLESFTAEECENIIKQINVYGDYCKQKFGTRLIFPSDEFYLKAGIPLPEDDFYEDYSQIENGVGMLTEMTTSFEYELEDYFEDYKEEFKAPRKVSVVTGFAAFDHISKLCRHLEESFDGLSVKVYPIKNNFFGEKITVAGLLTGKDMTEQLSGKELGDELLIPSVTLRAEGDVFLDDISPEQLSAALGGIKITPTSSDAREFISNVLGI